MPSLPKATALLISAGCGILLSGCSSSNGLAHIAVPALSATTLTYSDVPTGTASIPRVPNQTIPPAAIALPAAITIDTSDPSDWKIANGAISLDWNSLKGNVFALFLTGSSDNLVDVTNTSGGRPKGLYMDNAGFGFSTPTAAYTNAGSYLDWSITYPSSATNAYTYSEHFIVTPNDPGIHVYFVADHADTDITGGIGQVQWVFRDSLTQFTNTYSVDPSVNSPGPTEVPLPDSSQMFSTDRGRAVQDATVDLHGLTYTDGFTRSFYTKYDHAGYEYLHKAHGLFGDTYGAWTVLPSQETMPGGPTKQNLYFTGNILMIEAFSNHEDNGLSLVTPSGTASSHLFGPFYIHLNTFGQASYNTGDTITTPADMYADALAASSSFQSFYDSETQLVSSGYVPSTSRGSVAVQINGVSGTAHTSWAVLSDAAKNFQYSSAGYQYWADISTDGSATFTGVVPGTYRLSVYSLGQWGELRQDGVVVSANSTTTVPTQTFVPENFSTGTPLFTIGTADRSAHEFLHGHMTGGTYSNQDDREFWGAWNYWEDFASTAGAVVYNATDGPAGAATNDLSQWNYVHWGAFNPGLYGGVYSPTDDTTDGFQYAIPSYVSELPGATGTNGVTTKVPAWQVHFATPQDQSGSSAQAYVVLSVSLACTEASYIVTLNGKQLIWHSSNNSNCMIRSGLSGYTQWFALQWDASVLKPAGEDNVLTISTSQSAGDSEDALRMELTNTSADPAVRSWNDYEYIYKAVDTKANDAVPNP